MFDKDMSAKLFEATCPLKVNHIPYIGFAYSSDRGKGLGYVRVTSCAERQLRDTDKALRFLVNTHGSLMVDLYLETLNASQARLVMERMPFLRQYLEEESSNDRL